MNTQVTQCSVTGGVAPRFSGTTTHSHSWNYSDCLSISGPYGIWHIAKECMYDTLLQVPCVRVVLPRILSVCFRVSSAPHFTAFTWPEASTINCTSMDAVRKCVGNLLYTFTAAGHPIVHHLSEIGSGEHDTGTIATNLCSQFPRQWGCRYRWPGMAAHSAIQ
jgi:hypothetical protein